MVLVLLVNVVVRKVIVEPLLNFVILPMDVNLHMALVNVVVNLANVVMINVVIKMVIVLLVPIVVLQKMDVNQIMVNVLLM